MTPLQAAMISAAIANGGKLMKPYLVSEEQAPNLSVLSHTDPQRAEPGDERRPGRRS